MRQYEDVCCEMTDICLHRFCDTFFLLILQIKTCFCFETQTEIKSESV